MAVMMAKLYGALRAANVPDDQAVAAAEEAANFENRIANVDRDLAILKWMMGFNLAMTIAIVGKLFLGNPG